MELTVLEADITTLEVDAIVNAANADLAPGGGVCGAIFRAAGPGLVEACRPLAPCPTGGARVTPAFQLKAQWLIHAVGPVWKGGTEGEEAALADCYRAALSLAEINACASIAFPAISTGIYGFPPERAAPIAVHAVRTSEAVIEHVIFACFGPESAALHRRAVAADAG